MSIKLTKTTDAKLLLKLVAPIDSAIDWDETLPDVSEEERPAYFISNFKSITVKYLPDSAPTFFVFKHPSRIDVNSAVRSLFQSMAVAGKDRSDIATEIFNAAFIGTEDGLEAPLETVNKNNGRVSDAYLQALLDAGVFNDLANMFLQVYNDSKNQDNRKKK